MAVPDILYCTQIHPVPIFPFAPAHHAPHPHAPINGAHVCPLPPANHCHAVPVPHVCHPFPASFTRPHPPLHPFHGLISVSLSYVEPHPPHMAVMELNILFPPFPPTNQFVALVAEPAVPHAPTVIEYAHGVITKDALYKTHPPPHPHAFCHPPHPHPHTTNALSCAILRKLES